MITIQTKYSDQSGEINSEMTNDGKELKINLDGVEFVSNFLDNFETKDDLNNNRFQFDTKGILTNYTLLIKLPIKYQTDDIEKETTIDCNLKSTLSKSGHSETTATCDIKLNGETINIPNVDLFESLFVRLNKELNQNLTVKCCFNCLYSDYSVYGQGFWGTMLCFKNIKAEYIKIKNKDEYMEIMDDHSQMVQETFYCTEFKKRIEGTGYRG